MFIKKKYAILTNSILSKLFSLLLAIGLFTTSACNSEELAFNIIESPVLAVFEDASSSSNTLKMTATFYELDKSGILDEEIGIDSMLINGLVLRVFINENILLDEVTTNEEGKAVFEKAIKELDSATRLEWVGVYNDIAFRIYNDF